MTLLDGGSKETLAERWRQRNYPLSYILLAFIVILHLVRSYENHDGTWWKVLLFGALFLSLLIWRRPRATQL